MTPGTALGTRELVTRIQRYLRQSGVAVTSFGRQVANDPRLVLDMTRAGREPRPAMIAKIVAYLDRAEAALPSQP